MKNIKFRGKKANSAVNAAEKLWALLKTLMKMLLNTEYYFARFCALASCVLFPRPLFEIDIIIY